MLKNKGDPVKQGVKTMMALSFVLFPISSFGWDAKTFKKPDDAALQKKLTSEQYGVTQKEGTEYPFRNEYWNQHEDGIYVDIVSGEPLFSSKDKYESGTGWPSFSKPLVSSNLVEKKDSRSFLGDRTEIRSKYADSHLGHVFPDGPQPTGLRYCMNSASMRFIPKADLEKEGYKEFVDLFANNASNKNKSDSTMSNKPDSSMMMMKKTDSK